MTTSAQASDAIVTAAIEAACRSIAPNWPLDRQIAVSPYWGRVSEPFERALMRLHRQIGAAPAMSASYYTNAWESATIKPQHLARAGQESGLQLGPEALVDALRSEPHAGPSLRLLSDCADAERDRRYEPTWREAITQQVSQHCAAYFDRDQADWHLRPRAGLYASWREALCQDHSIALLMHVPDIRERARQLPLSARETIEWAVATLAVPPESARELFEVVLLRINGWAAWCAYLRWEAELGGATDDQIVDLLAIRLAWEGLLDDGRRDARSRWGTWQRLWSTRIAKEQGRPMPIALVWQRAHEIAYQDRLFTQLTQRDPHRPVEPPAPVRTQVVFCIDVRSERLRRALEAVEPGIHTLGFAGFFGLPIRYTPIGTQAMRPQLPGLLAPTLDVTETTGNDDLDRSVRARRQARLGATQSLRPFQRTPAAAFTIVESLGLAYVGKVLRASFSHQQSKLETEGLAGYGVKQLRPDLVLTDSAAVARRVDLAASILRAMSLTSGFARLVALVGHGSLSVNNPHAAGLDCGACGGQTGAINTRVLARVLNDPAVRHGLAERGIVIPDTTVVVAALHNTTTDAVQVFDGADVPETHQGDLASLTRSLRIAGDRTREERAASLGLVEQKGNPRALMRSLSHRARDWSQTRPEWGLADNAAFIVAPRARTRGIDLQGRSFLHDYRWQDDTDGAVLELVMTAPMIVTHWINLQYYASTVAPRHFGSGNKVLHNVVGGRIGIFEGNSGDLRIGLPSQSVHDGARWMHDPLRLSVVIDAPRNMIERVLQHHSPVRQLLDNEWLYLYRWEGASIERYLRGNWQVWAESSCPRAAAA
ncbi:MAG: DUF2309 domain-containing protein [Proteobacteria bacterium]|nr:DUF2309 domain-containing protein [Pseudomonadota bacterium]